MANYQHDQQGNYTIGLFLYLSAQLIQYLNCDKKFQASNLYNEISE